MVFTSRWLKIGPRIGRSNFRTARRLNFLGCFRVNTYNHGKVLQYSYFSVILGSLIKQCGESFSKFSCSSHSLHPMQSWNSEKNSGCTRPTLFVGWGELLGRCEVENAPETQKCPKTSVHDCRYTNLSLDENSSTPVWKKALISNKVWHISLPSLHNNNVKFPYATFNGGSKHMENNFSFSFS